MGTEHDPLLALRQSIKSKSKITYTTASGGPCPTLLASTSLIINSLPFPKGTRTRFRRGAGGATADFYTLDAVYVAWLLRDAPGAEYMKQAREHGLAVGFVSVTERKHVVDWLEGKVQESDRIAPLACAYAVLYIFDFLLFIEGFFANEAAVSTTPPGTPPRTAGQSQPITPRTRVVEAPTTTPLKRRYVADVHDVEVVKKIKQNEVELRDRNTVLRGTKANVRILTK